MVTLHKNLEKALAFLAQSDRPAMHDLDVAAYAQNALDTKLSTALTPLAQEIVLDLEHVKHDLEALMHHYNPLATKLALQCINDALGLMMMCVGGRDSEIPVR